MFRNESTEVIRKAKAKAAYRSRSVSPGSKPSTPAPEQDTEKPLILVKQSHSPVPTSLNPYHSMAPTIDEIATGFFFTNYILDVDRRPGNSAGYEINDNLSSCMKAVGLATLASTANAPELIQEVRLFGAAPSDSGLLPAFQEMFGAERRPLQPGSCSFSLYITLQLLSWLMGFLALVFLPKSESLSQDGNFLCCAP